MELDILIVMPISRPDYLRRVFHSLEMLECNRESVGLFTYIDGDDRLYETGRNFTVSSKFNYRKALFRAKGVGSVSGVRRRRKRIADIHEEMKLLMPKAKYVLLIEDDTYIPSNVITKMKNDFLTNSRVGFITGLQVGRWGWKHLGAWRVNDVYDVDEVTSIKVPEGIEEIDGAGLFCCFTTMQNYHMVRMEPFGMILGPDFNFGIKLRRQGLKNYVDGSIRCTHMTKTGDLNVEDVIQVQLLRTGENQWTQAAL